MKRTEFLRKAVNRPIPATLLLFLSALGIYDTVVSHFLPDEVAKDAPRLWQVIAATADYVPGWSHWVWLVIFLVLLSGIFFEFAFRLAKSASAAPQPSAPSAPKQVERKTLDTSRKPYAYPPEAEKIDIKTTTNKELGKLMVALSVEITDMMSQTKYREVNLTDLFNKKFASIFFCLYEEARNRGHREEELEIYYLHPERLRNVLSLNAKLRALGNRLPLYLDA